MNVELFLDVGNPSRTVAPIQQGYYLIGRHSECQIRPKSSSVSRRHCLIFHSQDGIWLMDLESTRGTFINQRRLEPKKWQPLQHGDDVRIGKVSFLVSIRNPVGSPTPEPSDKNAKREFVTPPNTIIVNEDNDQQSTVEAKEKNIAAATVRGDQAHTDSLQPAARLSETEKPLAHSVGPQQRVHGPASPHTRPQPSRTNHAVALTAHSAESGIALAEPPTSDQRIPTGAPGQHGLPGGPSDDQSSDWADEFEDDLSIFVDTPLDPKDGGTDGGEPATSGETPGESPSGEPHSERGYPSETDQDGLFDTDAPADEFDTTPGADKDYRANQEHGADAGEQHLDSQKPKPKRERLPKKPPKTPKAKRPRRSISLPSLSLGVDSADRWKLIGALLAAVLFVGYFGYQLTGAFKGPEVRVLEELE